MTTENSVEEPLSANSNNDANNNLGKGSAHNRGLGGGSSHGRGLRKSQIGQPVAKNTIRRTVSGDSNHSRGLSGGSGHSRGLRKNQAGQAAAANTIRRTLSNGGSNHSRGLSGGSGHSRGLRKSQVGAPVAAGAASRSPSPNGGGPPTRVAAAPRSIPRRTRSSEYSTNGLPQRAPSVDDSVNRGLRGGKKAAPSQPEPAMAQAAVRAVPSPSPMPPMPVNADGKGLRRSRATAPGAVSESAAPASATGSDVPPHSSGDGKMRGRARATAPGAVSEAVANGTEPAPNGRRQVSPKRMAAPVSKPPEKATQEDAQAIRRKQIQEIMKNSQLSQQEKQRKIQELMATGMPTQAPISNEDNSQGGTKEAELLTGDPQAIRRKQMQEIMKDSSLSQREKQLKMQQLMSGGMLKGQPSSLPPAGASSSEDPQAVRRKQIQEIMKDTSLTPQERQSGIQRLMAGGMPKTAPASVAATEGGGKYVVPGGNQRRGLRKGDARTSSSSPTRASGTTLNSSSAHSTGRTAAGADLGPSFRGRAVNDSSLNVSSSHSQASGAAQGTVRRTATTPVPRPGAMGVVEPTAATFSKPGASTGVGGAPQGKIRRTATATATRPGAVGVVEPSLASPNEPGASTGVGGAPQGKIRRSAPTPATLPGAVGVVEPSLSPPSEPGAATGVGGAPQGKIRRTVAAPASKPGATHVVEPSSGGSGASTGVGGAPQGKIRQTSGSVVATRPGATSVIEPAASVPSEPGSSTGFGGAPQGKIRGTATALATRPGAVGVVEPSLSSPSEPGASTGVGGAPQGKIRRTVAAPVTRPGAVSTVEPGASIPSEPGAATGVGGAPQGKMRRSKGRATAPGAVNSVELNRSEPGGAPIDRSSHHSSAGSEPRALAPAASAMSQSSLPGSSSGVASSIERDMLAKSNVRRSRPASIAPGAQSVDFVVASEPGQDAGSAAENALLNNSRASSSVRQSATSRGIGNRSTNDSAHGISHNSGHSAASSTIDSLRSRLPEPSQAPSLSEQPENRPYGAYDQQNPAENNDFDTAIQLVDDDIQAKMRARAPVGTSPAVPGAMQAEAKPALSEKDLGFHVSHSNPAYDDLDTLKDKEKESGKAGSYQFLTSEAPTTHQDRMELKIMQMEREQQSRDDKLEELEEATTRRPRQNRHKVEPSPQHRGPDPFEDEGSVENNFLNPDPDVVRQAEEDGLAIAVAVEEDDEPDVYDVELKMYDPEAKPPFFKNRRFRCYSALICCVVLAAIITAVVISAKKGNEVILVTQAPSSAPSQAPTTPRETAVRGELARVIGDIVNEPDTVFEKALDWILYEDTMQLNEFSENLIQRFTLALFYHQTSQERNWTSCNPPLDDEDYTCEFFEMIRQEDGMTVEYFPRDELEVRWLSERHECEWAEVQCHPEADGNVIAIDIIGQNLTGTLPEELKHLDRLMWLTLSSNDFDGTIPEAYGEFDYLTIFEVTENSITGQIPSGFFRQPSLLQLSAAFNMITGTIPPEIGDLTTLHSVFLFGTEIGGTLPTEMGLLEDIRNLWLHDNSQLSGTLPSELGQLSLLESLYLGNNGHTGNLPSELGLLSNNFKSFLFSGNNMGTIPEEFWNATSLRELDVESAGFGGTLSTNIGRMTNLIGFKGARNEFTGSVPSELGLINSMQLLWVHGNGFSGDIPLDICLLRGPENLRILNADCAGFTPKITCACCTGCCDEFGVCQRV